MEKQIIEITPIETKTTEKSFSVVIVKRQKGKKAKETFFYQSLKCRQIDKTPRLRTFRL